MFFFQSKQGSILGSRYIYIVLKYRACTLHVFHVPILHCTDPEAREFLLLGTMAQGAKTQLIENPNYLMQLWKPLKNHVWLPFFVAFATRLQKMVYVCCREKLGMGWNLGSKQNMFGLTVFLEHCSVENKVLQAACNFHWACSQDICLRFAS